MGKIDPLMRNIVCAFHCFCKTKTQIMESLVMNATMFLQHVASDSSDYGVRILYVVV